MDQRRLYYVPEERIWLEIQFSHVLDSQSERIAESILVTKQKLCEWKFQLKKSLGRMVTSAGIQIGDSFGKTVEVYGTPSVSIEIGKEKSFSVLMERLNIKDGRIIRYLPNQADEINFAKFYFDKTGLHSILISRSE